jgi:GNAT superfamily N-acetyltransferase
VIRAPVAADLEVVLDLQERASLASLKGVFPPSHPLPTEVIRQRWSVALASSDNRFRVFEDRGQIVGVSLIAPPWLHALHVLPERWGTGVAGALHEDALQAMRSADAQEAFLRVFAGNAIARRFWEKHGWELLPWASKPHRDPPHPEMLTYWRAL